MSTAPTRSPDDMSDQNEQTPASSGWWTTSSTMKERNTIQRAVNALLDELAPERPASRSGREPQALERYRTPSGCVLQAPAEAVTVSWFPESSGDANLGELHVLLWSGVVTRRGSPPRPGGSTVVRETVLRPMDAGLDGAVWRTEDGTTYDTSALAEYCLSLFTPAADAGATGATGATGSDSIEG